MKRLVLALLFSVLLAPAAWSAPAYVTDDLTVALRSGATTGHRILRLLPSGTAVEVLQESNDWSRVRTDEGLEGWIESRFLSSTPGAARRLERATNTVESLRQELQAAKQQLAEQGQQLSASRAQAAQLNTANEQMKRQLAEAGRGLALVEENKELRKQANDLQREKDLLNNDVERLKDRSARDWFVAGAAVVLISFALGFVVSRISRKRKSSWSSL